jgi:hypothetical protein
MEVRKTSSQGSAGRKMSRIADCFRIQVYFVKGDSAHAFEIATKVKSGMNGVMSHQN